MSQIVRALRPFKVQVAIGEFLHFKTGDRIPHDLLTGPYRGYVMGHCEVANTKVAGHVPVAEPERTVEPTSRLKAEPPPLKEQWKNVPKDAVKNVTETVATAATPPVQSPPVEQAETGHASRAASGKGHHTGKAKPHASGPHKSGVQ